MKKDYYGAENYQGEIRPFIQEVSTDDSNTNKAYSSISPEEYDSYIQSGILPEGYQIEFERSNAQLVSGQIVLDTPTVIIKKQQTRPFSLVTDRVWDGQTSILVKIRDASIEALRAIVPLCLFLYLVLRLFLKQTINRGKDLFLGICFAILGMALFALGISLGLSPLGTHAS